MGSSLGLAFWMAALGILLLYAAFDVVMREKYPPRPARDDDLDRLPPLVYVLAALGFGLVMGGVIVLFGGGVRRRR